MAKQTKVAAKQVIASQTKIAATALKEIKFAVKTRQMSVIELATKRLYAAVDAAEAAASKAGSELTEAQMKGFGYVKTAGHVWEIRTAEDEYQAARNKRLWRKIPASLRQERDQLYTTIVRLTWVNPKNPDNFDSTRYHDGLRRPTTKALLSAWKKVTAVEKQIHTILDELSGK